MAGGGTSGKMMEASIKYEVNRREVSPKNIEAKIGTIFNKTIPMSVDEYTERADSGNGGTRRRPTRA
jgi:hypothetical protein